MLWLPGVLAVIGGQGFGGAFGASAHGVAVWLATWPGYIILVTCTLAAMITAPRLTWNRTRRERLSAFESALDDEQRMHIARLGRIVHKLGMAPPILLLAATGLAQVGGQVGVATRAALASFFASWTGSLALILSILVFMLLGSLLIRLATSVPIAPKRTVSDASPA